MRQPLWGYRHNVAGDWESGRLGWSHRQEADKPSYYAIYFDPMPEGKRIEVNPRCGWIGDGSTRFAPLARTTTSRIHSRIALADWNGDGLTDILCGVASGGFFVYPNLGDAKNPKFSIARLIFLEDGLPLDNGGQNAPLVADVDADGAQDLIVGTEYNRTLFYRNVGTNAEPRLRFHSFLKADGKILLLPHAPSPETEPQYTYTRDYYPVWEACDWNGDGKQDLLGGGYVTGRVYFHENMGKGRDGLPILHDRGPIEADGEPLDVTWAASPCAADFDGDGDLDLISGCMQMVRGGDAAAGDLTLRYYENVGTRTNPRLTLRPFPKNAPFPRGLILTTPRAADLNGDGLLDIVMSAYDKIYVWPNIGTPTQPRWDVRSSYLVPPGFGAMPLREVLMADFAGHNDGQLDILTDYGYFRNLGQGNPGVFSDDLIPIVQGPGEISHPTPYGDPYSFKWFADLNGEGRLHCLYGDHGGYVWFHRQLAEPGQFDIAGVRLKQTDGQLIQVGKMTHKKGFDVLQGARTTIATGDIDLDGRLDLVLGDTTGAVYYYRNAGGRPVPQFDSPILAGSAPIRVRPAVADWDGDGRLDIIAPHALDARLWLNKKKGQGVEFVKVAISFPGFLASDTVVMALVDFNGDGDADIVARTSANYCNFFERSFLQHGYVEAKMIAAQRR